MSRSDVIPTFRQRRCKTGAGTSFGANGDPLHEQSPSTYFLCLNNSETFVELVGARPLHLANARPFGRLKAPLGLSLLRCAAQTRACLWQAEQAHHAPSKEKQSVPDCWVSVKQFSKNDTATACQDWLRSTRLGRGSIKSHVRTVKVLGMGLFAFQERVHLWKGVTH